MSAVCQHRGQIIVTEAGSAGRAFRCPLHFWRYDLSGELLGATRIEDGAEMDCLKGSIKLPAIGLELWHGFLFVNLDPEAPPLAPSLAKLEPFWAGYEDSDLVPVPPTPADEPLPWNWKIHAENFTDAYHPEFVHCGTHDFAPSNHPDGGVEFTPMSPTDNAIVRTVPLLQPDGGMMMDGWGEDAQFPAIETLSPAQRRRVTFALLPPGMTLTFAPGAIAYQLITPVGVTGTLASNDRVTASGWLLPRSTYERSDFADRAARAQRRSGCRISRSISAFRPASGPDLYRWTGICRWRPPWFSSMSGCYGRTARPGMRLKNAIPPLMGLLKEKTPRKTLPIS